MGKSCRGLPQEAARAGPGFPARPRSTCSLLGCGRGRRDDVDDATLTPRTELDVPGDQGEQRVVATAADAVARVEVGAALADDDLAGVDQLPAEALDPEPLGVRVAAV